MARAVDLLASAQRIEFYAVGQDGVVADEAQVKFLRFGVPCSSVTEARLQVLPADVVKPNDVVVVISSSGRTDQLLAVADTANQSPLARKADVALIVDHVEDVATHVPMVSRILHLLVIDILAVGVAMRPEPQPVGAKLAG